jgi:stage II sporulation protein R
MSKKTENILKIISAFVFALVCILPGGADAVNFDGEILRFHVLANSNTKEDQELKLKVRNKVLHEWKTLGKSAENAKDAENIAIKELSLLREATLDVIDEEGYDYDVSVSCGVYPFPQKSYGNVTLPEGNYNAIRVVIGEGKGDNWWCVMYPPLCFVKETAVFEDDALSGLSSKTISKITGTPQINVKFKLTEILKNLVERN